MSMKSLIVGAAVVLAVTGCSSPAPSGSPTPSATPSPSMFALDGHIDVPISVASALNLIDKKEAVIGLGTCTAKDGYDDVHDNAQVTITDESGKVLALGNLGPGTLWATEGQAVVASSCRFQFGIPVPVGAKFYGVEVAHRGVIRFTSDEVTSEIELTLGK